MTVPQSNQRRNYAPFILGGVVGGMIGVIATSLLSLAAYIQVTSARMPASPIEVQDIDGRGNSGLIVPTRDGTENHVFVSTNKTERAWIPYREVARDLANGYEDKIMQKLTTAAPQISLSTIR